jgi:hypothetical protein
LGERLKAHSFNEEQKDKYDLTMTTRTAEDKARAGLKPVADPDAERASRRKKAARGRMRGRAGTILTDSLGARGKLG